LIALKRITTRRCRGPVTGISPTAPVNLALVSRVSV
jgi:hypothetical protein